MRTYTKKYSSLAIAVTTALLAACGGGGGSSSGSTAGGAGPAMGTITGTVPGTKIEAFGDNGSYYETTSVNNNTSKHPFSLQVPAGVGVHVVMTMDQNDNDPTNDVVQPIGFKDKNGVMQSRLVLGAGDKADMGNIPLVSTRQAATVAGLDNNGDGILDTPMVLDDPQAQAAGAKNPLKTVDADADGVDDFDDVDGGGHTLDSANGQDPQDPDNNGIPNVYDPTVKGKLASGVNDTDSDGLPDSIDVNPANAKDKNVDLPNSKDGFLNTDKNHDGFPDGDMNHDGIDENTNKPDDTGTDG